MNKLVLICFLLFFTGFLHAQPDVKYLNVSLWNPVAISPYQYNNTTIVSLGLLQSKVNDLYGFDANLFSGVTTGKMYGFQFSGLHSRIEGTVKGVTVAGFFNTHRSSMSGLEISGLSNMNLVNQYGMQLSAVQNICMLNTEGVQVAAFVNVTGRTMSGVQFAGGFNVADVSYGVQFAGAVNFALAESRGVQIAATNYATKMQGVQLGAFNFARRMKGVQIGVFNYSADTSTVKIGLISISPKTKICPMIYYSSLATLNLAFRFMNRLTYTIVGIGTPYDAPHTSSSGMFFYRLGIYRQLGKVTLSSDVGASYISEFNNARESNALSGEGRVNLEFAINKQLSLMCSGGCSVRRFFTKGKSTDVKPIVEIGLILPNLLKSSR